MTPSLGLTMITLVAGAGLSVHWQAPAGVTQQVLAVLLTVFYVSPPTAMNVAIQLRVRERGWRAKRQKPWVCVCVCFERTR